MGFWVFFFTNVFAYISVELFWIYLKLKGVSFFFFPQPIFFTSQKPGILRGVCHVSRTTV